MGLVNSVSDKLDDAEKSLELVRTRASSAQSLGGNRIIASGTSVKTPAAKSVDQTTISFDPIKSLESLSTVVNLKGDIDLTSLANKLLPLLEHIDTELELNVSEQINSFREKLLKHSTLEN